MRTVNDIRTFVNESQPYLIELTDEKVSELQNQFGLPFIVYGYYSDYYCVVVKEIKKNYIICNNVTVFNLSDPHEGEPKKVYFIDPRFSHKFTKRKDGTFLPVGRDGYSSFSETPYIHYDMSF